MRTVHIQPLTHEAFAPFGQFYPMEQPQGYALCGELHRFFPDRLSADSQHRVGFSPILVKKPERMLITQQEYHTTTWEMILPMNDDMILHCAPASAGTPVTEQPELAFFSFGHITSRSQTAAPASGRRPCSRLRKCIPAG